MAPLAVTRVETSSFGPGYIVRSGCQLVCYYSLSGDIINKYDAFPAVIIRPLVLRRQAISGPAGITVSETQNIYVSDQCQLPHSGSNPEGEPIFGTRTWQRTGSRADWRESGPVAKEYLCG